MYKLVLIRHGESTWNLENRFTGWTDVAHRHRRRAGAGRGPAAEGGGYDFDVAYTSVLKRAIRTLWHALDELDRTWLPVVNDWRLNERHYGALQGLNKAETAKQLRRRAGAGLAPQLRRAAARARARRPAQRTRRPALRRAGAEPDPAHRMPEGHRGPRAAYWNASWRRRSAPASAVLVAAHGN